MFSLFGKPKDKRTPQEKYDDMKKDIKANVRAVDRQIRSLEREQKKMDLDIKKAAKAKSSPAILKAKCQSRVRLQKAIEKMIMVRANTESMLTTITIQKAQILQATAMKGATISMRQISEGMGASEMAQICNEFQREMMKNELINDQINDLSFDDNEEEVDEEVAKVLMEVAGISAAELNLAGAGGLTLEQEAEMKASALPALP